MKREWFYILLGLSIIIDIYLLLVVVESMLSPNKMTVIVGGIFISMLAYLNFKLIEKIINN